MVDLIPRSVLFGNPERTSPRMSHDGSQLGWIAPRDGVLNVWVAPIGESDGVDWAAARAVTDDTDRGVRMFGWAWDGRHLLYVQDVGGDENWRLYDVDLVTGERRDLTPFEKIHAQIIGSSKRRPTEVLVGINADNPQLHDVYRLDLVTGNLVKEIENPGYAGWLADEDLVVRCALAPLPDGSLDVLVRDSASADWRTLLTDPRRGRDVQRRGVVQRRRQVAGDDQRGRGRHRAADAGRPRDRRDHGARRGPRGGRRRRRAAPGHPRPADRHDPQGPDDLRRARPVGRRRPEGDSRAAPRRPDVPRAGRGRPDVAGRLHRRRRVDHLLHVRPSLEVRPAAVRGAARAVVVHAGGHGAVLVHGQGRAGDPRLRDVPARAGPVVPAGRA